MIRRSPYVPRRFYVMAWAAIMPIGLFSLALHADVLTTKTGNSGTDGTTDNSKNPPQGTDAGKGDDAAATNAADATAPNYHNEADATGGNGGSGGNGGTVGLLLGAGGSGGNGGNAYAGSQITNHPVAVTSVLVQATGGNGGVGGNAGVGRGGTHGKGGKGGDGGSATIGTDAPVIGYNSGNLDSIGPPPNNFLLPSSTVNAVAVGGNGGSGGSGSNSPGGNGGAAFIGTVQAVSDTVSAPDTGSASASASATGGSGGLGMGGGAGGNGADVNLTNVVSGASSKEVVLEQDARGGSSGGSTGTISGVGGSAGLAGNATSILSIPSGSTINVLAAGTGAAGGSAGAVQSTAGSAGGNATAVTNLAYNSQELDGFANADGGSGSNLTAGAGSAGAGGTASGTTIVVNTASAGSRPVSAQVFSFGGGGGSVSGSAVGNAGAGGPAFSNVSLTAQSPALSTVFTAASFANISVNGAGGTGGSVSGSASGNAGRGGDVFANATGSALAGGAIIAGIGGNGGIGGSVTGTGTGNGGDGGNVNFNLVCNEPNAAQVTENITTTGGNGGKGQGAGFSGGNGGSPLLGNQIAFSATGTVTVLWSLTSGSGGAGVAGAAGGNGPDVTLINAINSGNTGTAGGALTLIQSAHAGNSGGSDGANPGLAGNATSILNFSSNGPATLSGVAEAQSGSANSVQNINGNAGGNANASLMLSGDHLLNATASATGAAGAPILAGLSGLTAGAGGNAAASATGLSTNSSPGTSALNVYANAAFFSTGGDVGASLVGNGGAGGSATALSAAFGLGPDLVESHADATGQSGGQGSGFGFFSGNGGNAASSATASTSGGGTAVANATATAGNAGPIVNSASPGIYGSASATASAVALTATLANAFATGASGVTTAITRITPGGLLSFVQSMASTPVDSAVGSVSESLFNQGAPGFQFGTVGVSANSVGSPLAADVTNRWSSYLNVKNAFNNTPSNVNVLLFPLLQHPPTGSIHTYSSIFEVNENNAQLSSNAILLGAVDPQFVNSGIFPGDSLRFRIQRNGALLVDQTFSDNANALNFFQNTVLNLGAANADLNGANLDLQFLLDFTTSHTGAGFGIQLLLGTAPSGSPAGIWNNPQGGSWAMPVNWSAEMLPLGPATSVTFGSAITASHTVTLDQITTVGSIAFNNANAYTLNPGLSNFSLILDNAGSPASITLNAGSHSINVPISFASPGLILAVAAGNTLTLSANLTGPGLLTLNGPGSVLLAPGTGAAKINALSIAHSGPAYSAKLDLTTNKLIIQTFNPADKQSKIADLNAAITSGFNNGIGGGWTGNGITSSTVAANAAHYGLGLFDNALLNLTQFGGEPTNTNSILTSIAHLGDANDNGIVDIQDLTIIANHWQNNSSNTPTFLSNWAAGDLNRDNVVDIQDFTLVANNWQQSSAFPLYPAPYPLSPSSVPEPTSLLLLSLLSPLLLRPKSSQRRSLPF